MIMITAITITATAVIITVVIDSRFFVSLV